MQTVGIDFGDDHRLRHLTKIDGRPSSAVAEIEKVADEFSSPQTAHKDARWGRTRKRLGATLLALKVDDRRTARLLSARPKHAEDGRAKTA